MTNKQLNKAKTRGHHSQTDEIKLEKTTKVYSDILNGYREEGVKKSVTREHTYTKCHPFSPNKSTSLPHGFP